jgi:hypothetical protein
VDDTEAQLVHDIIKALYTSQLEPGIGLLDAVRGLQAAKKVRFVVLPFREHIICLRPPDII